MNDEPAELFKACTHSQDCRRVKCRQLNLFWSKKIMRKFVLLRASLFAVVLTISASPVRAQNVLWVSAFGNDANACTQASPCLTFQTAINKSSVTQINCLTSGNFGPISVTASIIIDCGTGNVGNIANPNGDAILISPNVAVTVVLRHLALSGPANTGQLHGINAKLFSSGTLIVEDCTILGFQNGYGIIFAPHTGRGLLQVSNARIADNATGIGVSPVVNQIASVTLNQVELVANSNLGLALTGNGIVAGTMRNSVAGENLGGIYAGSGQVFFTIEGSSIVANPTFGIQTATANSIVSVGASTIGGNGTGVSAMAGSLISFGNNQFGANGSDGDFTDTKALK
jgi:hypothetical protein